MEWNKGKGTKKRNIIIEGIREPIVKTKINTNINYIYNIGFLLSTGVAIQATTGITLSMQYKTGSITGTLDESYDIIENINRDIRYGRAIKNMHSAGVSLIFVPIYIHIGKGIYYGSYTNKRKIVYRIGILIEMMMIAIAFLGYSLPLGDQSYWAISVITNIPTVIPIIGESIVEFI